MNRLGTSPLHTPGALRPGRRVRGQSRANAQGSFASGAIATPRKEVKAMQSPENDETVSRPSHSPASRSGSARGDGGNGATVRNVENDTTVSHVSPSRVQIADGTGDSHIPTVTGYCGGVSSCGSNSRSKPKSKTFAILAVLAGRDGEPNLARYARFASPSPESFSACRAVVLRTRKKGSHLTPSRVV